MKNDTGTLELRLQDTACSHGETLASLLPEWRPKFRNAKILNNKGHIEMYGCWLLESEGTVVVMLQDGAMMALELKGFKETGT
jgi:hypothetical protein